MKISTHFASSAIVRQILIGLTTLALLSFSGCSVGGGDDEDDGTGETIADSTFILRATTNQQGLAVVSFGVAENSTKFAITAQTNNSGARLRFVELENEDGTDYLMPNGLEISLATSSSPFVKAATVPSRSSDPNIDNDDTFLASVQAIDNSGRSIEGEEITFTINSKEDSGLEGGTMRVNMFFVGEVGNDAETMRIVRESYQTAEDIYSSQAGINLQFNELVIDGPIVLPSPNTGSSFYNSATSSAPTLSTNVFIGGDIGGVGGSTVLGFAPDIPSPAIPSPRSGLAVSFFAGAGPDGSYSQEEVRLLGETIGHEAGHFAGLFHPIDFAGNTVAFEDPLTDTNSCSFFTDCLADSTLITNLMYPNPVDNDAGDSIPQNRFTPQQRSVLNRYISVD